MSIFRWLFGKKNKDKDSPAQIIESQGKIPRTQGTEPAGEVSEAHGIELNEKVPVTQNVQQEEKDGLLSISENELAFHTRGQKNPKGLPRIFFACHPEDFERYFRKIVDMVDAFRDVAFFYEDPEKDLIPWEDLAGRLSDMQLIIMPVSARLLFKENRAVREILPFANEKHIPVLPIMFDNGLDDRFQEIFGDLQYLMPENRDATAIPFEQKLEKYLEGVLVGSEMAQRVRDAFDAYIFLSYRKKDRAYAQELMRMIHKSDRYRDIAIWYDEYLVPGENFNDAIQAALEKGRLFTLVVTPSLLEKDNYVMLHEYPAAKEAGKPILPAQMVKTDREKLEAYYKEIPDSVDVRDGESWEQAAVQYFRELAVTKKRDDPQHTFLIGLAYLDGIDVEVDSRKAEELIIGAADEGLTEAMEKLVAMYHDGKGVERDYRRSAKWQESLVNALRENWQKSRQQADLRGYIGALLALGVAYMDLRDLEAAGNAFKEMKTVAEIQIEEGDSKGLRSLSVSYEKLGDIEQGLGNPEGAKRNYEKAFEISEELARETNTVTPRWDLFAGYCKLGDIEQELGNLKGAKRYYEKAFEISEKLARERNMVVLSRAIYVCYGRIGDIEEALGNLVGAKRNYEKALEITEKLARETKTVETCRDLALCYSRSGDIEKGTGNLKGAKSHYEKALEISEKLAEKTSTVESHQFLAICYDRSGDIEKSLGNLEGAKGNYEKAFEIREKLAGETNTIASLRDLSVSYTKIGEIVQGLGNLKGAKRNYEKAFEIREKLAGETNTIASLRDLSVSYTRLGEIEQVLGNPQGAKRNYKKALEIRERLARETNTIESRRDLSVSYNKLGAIEKSQGNLEGAKRNYKKALEIRERLARETNTIESLRDLSVSYSNLGDIEQVLGNQEGAKRNYEKALETFEKLARETKTVESYRDLSLTYERISNIEQILGDLEGAKSNCEKAHEIREKIAEETKTVGSYRDLSLTFERLGDIEQALGNPEGAKRHYEQDLEIREKLARETKTVSAYDDLALSYYKMGTLAGNIDREYLTKAYKIWESLARSCPSMPIFARRLDGVKHLLQG